MDFYKAREQYNRDFARTHYQVLHNGPVPGEADVRRSFFRINDEEELLAASRSWIHFPCMVMVGLSGGLFSKGESVRQVNYNIVMFLTKLQADPGMPVMAAAITNAYNETFEVMRDYVSRINEDYEEGGTCGFFHDFDPGRVKWEQAGPLGDQLYGWILNFSDDLKGSYFLKYDPAHFVPLSASGND